MKNTIGILGFLILTISAVYIDTPIIAILALPVFLVGSILVLIFYLKQIDKERINTLQETIIIIGVVSLCALLGYAAVGYNQFQGYLGRNQELSWNWDKILIVTAINFFASLLIFIGIWKGNNYQFDQVIEKIIPTLLVIPITLLLIKLSVVSGIWMGASI